MKDLIDELEAFNNAHKSRSVDFSVGTGYGATCWEITLGSEKGVIYAAECSFFQCAEPDGYINNIPYWNLKSGNGIGVFVVDPRDDNNWSGWPGLRPVLELALETARAMELPFKYEE